MKALIAKTIHAKITNLRGNNDNDTEGNSQAHANMSRQDNTIDGQLNVDDLMRRINQVEDRLKLSAKPKRT